MSMNHCSPSADATVIVTTANQITFLVLHEWDWLASVLGYWHKVIWLADACVTLEKFSTSATSNGSEATRRAHNSVRQCLTSLH